MLVKQIVIYVVIWTLAVVSAKNVPQSRQEEEEKDDVEGAESSFIKTLSSLRPQFNDGNSDTVSALAPQFGDSRSGTVDDLSSFPYEDHHALFNSYGAPPVPQPSFGVAVNTQAVLAPQVEILRLIEAFIKLKGELLNRLYALINDNWDLIRQVLNLVIGKLQNLHSFSLTGISILRKIFEFALNLFADWSFTLPSITLGTSGTAFVQPHSTYGAPAVPSGGIANFLQGWNNS